MSQIKQQLDRIQSRRCTIELSQEHKELGRRLTDLQRLYVHELVSGRHQSQGHALAAAQGKELTPAVRQYASAILKKSHVVEYKVALQRAVVEAVQIPFNRSDAILVLADIATDQRARAADRIAAIRQVCEMQGWKEQSKDTMTVKEIVHTIVDPAPRGVPDSVPGSQAELGSAASAPASGGSGKLSS